MKLFENEALESYAVAKGGAPAYMPMEHQIRWERLRVLRMLFEGKHRQVYLDEGRTEFDYPEQDINGKIVKPYYTMNLLRLMSIKTADLLFGGKVKLSAPTPAQQDRTDLLARDSFLHSRFHSAVVLASWGGASFLSSVLFEGEPYIEVIEPDELYPIGSMLPNGQYASYVRYATANVGSDENPRTLLLTTTYRAGSIERKLQTLNKDGKIEAAVDLKEWPAYGGNPPQSVESTGISENTITYVPNELGGKIACSDYDGLIGNQDAVNAKYQQVNRVIAQHTDPNLAMPASEADKTGNATSRNKVHFYNTKDDIPQYITYQAQLDPAMKDRTAAVLAFCMTGEVSPVLLGLKEGAAPDAARKLILEATNFVAKVARKALLITPAIARSIRVVQLLDQTSSYHRQYPVDVVGVQMRDGLPVDEKDKADTIAIWRSAGLISMEAGVEARIEDPDEAAIEIDRIKKEQAASTPSVLMNETNTTETQQVMQ